MLLQSVSCTPLQAAAEKGHVSCCKILLKHGVDVNAVNLVSLVNATTALSNKSPYTCKL